MWKHRIRRPSPALMVASIALLVALGGTSYATVLQVPRNSVGTLQLKRNAVKPAKLAPNAVRTAHVLNGSLLATDFRAGQLPTGPKGDKGDKGDRGERGPKGDPGATDVVVRWSPVFTTTGSGTFLGRRANCDEGEIALGGGGGSTVNGGSTSAITLHDSKPFPLATGGRPTGWHAGFSITGAGVSVAAYVICASP